MGKKNVIWWPALVNEDHIDKYGGYDYLEYSRKSLEYWCKKNDVLFVPFTQPVKVDFKEFRPQWQKCLFVFDELERMGIDYDQIWLLDSSAIIKWDCPNVFELTDRKFTGVRDMDNMRWVYESVEGYKSFFNNFEFDTSKYINSGCVIFNETHRELFKSFQKLYYDKKDTFIDLQDNKVRKGNDQTPMNYWLQINDVDINLLPFIFDTTHIQRKEMFSYNWQLNEDKTPFFIKYSYVWRFNGIPKEQRTELMKQTWDLVKHNYTFDEIDILLNSVNHKDTFKNATSRQFKKDLIEFFDDDKYKDMSVVELGACHGDTTKVFSHLFKNIHAVDWRESNIELVKQKCKDSKNVSYQVLDTSSEEWNFPKADVVFIDASHDYPQVEIDIEKTINYFKNPIIVLDDYGNPNNTNIRRSINKKVQDGKLKIHKNIGEYPGFKTKSGWSMIDREGVICNV